MVPSADFLITHSQKPLGSVKKMGLLFMALTNLRESGWLSNIGWRVAEP
jgi:hypothetical protein